MLFILFILLLNNVDEIFNCARVPNFVDNFNHFQNLDDNINILKYSHNREDEIDGFLIKIKYKPTVLLQKYTFMETPVSSVCFKCGLCLAIAEKLEQILTFAMKSSIPLVQFDDEMSAKLLRPVCDYAFSSYGLKEWNELRIISHHQFLENVPNSMDGHWPDILQKTCHFYLNHFGEDNLVKQWLLEPHVNVTSLLCRNDGLFRDCLNVSQGFVTIQFPSRFLSPSNQIKINYPCV